MSDITDDAHSVINRLLNLRGHETFAYGQGSYDGDACRACQWQGPPQSGEGHTQDTRRDVFTDVFTEWAAGRAEHTAACSAVWMAAGGCTCTEQEAASRAETTTEDAEDADVTDRAFGVIWSAVDDRGIRGRLYREDVVYLVQALADANLLATAPPEATAEDAARVLVRETTSGLCEYGRVCDECDCFADAGGDERDAHARELARALAAAGLLATARTRPTREQIMLALDLEGAFCGLCSRDPGAPLRECPACADCLGRYADAVLARLDGGETGR